MIVPMDRAELEIAEIKDISYIKYYMLPDGSYGLFVMYGRNKTINLCEYDKYFRSLEETAARICSEQGEKILTADDFTRNVLESRGNSDVPDFLAPFVRLTGSIVPIREHEKSTVKLLQSFIYYFLKDIYSDFSSEVTFDGGITGYRRRYSIECQLDGEKKIIPFDFRPHDSGYIFRFGNVFEPHHTFTLKTEYYCDRITVTADCALGRLTRREYNFYLTEEKLRLRIFDGGEIAYSRESKLGNGTACPDFIRDKIFKVSRLSNDGFCGVMLPWGEYYLSRRDKDSFHGIIADTDGKNGIIKHFYRKYSDESFIFDSSEAVHSFSEENGGLAVITYFKSTGCFTKGIYKERLENKFFYSFIDADAEL